jgi:secreted PhoX family phosphatase
MNEKQLPLSRRTLLQWASSASLTPALSAIGGSSLLAACGGGDGVAAKATAVVFNNMAAPSSDADRATTFTNATASVTMSDNTTKTVNLSYKTLYKTGDVLKRPDGGSVVAGGYYYPDGVTPIIDTSGATPVQYFSDCPDGQSLIKLANPTVPGMTGNTLFLVTQFEYKSEDQGGTSMYGKLPSQIGIATLDQDKTTGDMKVKSYYTVPTTDVHGLWITCASSQSPWDTHLSSEEYEPDAWTIATNTQFKAFSLNTFGSETAAKPYHYGHVPEVTVHPDGTGSIKKHYCMGRISREKVKVMPDNKTVLQGDDATSGGIFMFVADVAGELSSGTLYVARLTQTSATAGGTFDISWIKLGHANSTEIEAMANTYQATDLLEDVKTTDPSDATYTMINYGSSAQWVKFKGALDTSNKAAAFLETRRFAAALGATMELTKFEGVTVDTTNKKAYFAMSAIKDSMTAGKYAGGDAITLAKLSAGATFEVTLATDATIGSDWVPTKMSVPTALLGEDMSADTDGNTAVVAKIANPDNLSFSNNMGTLFIGEDSGMHLNNYVWAYNVSSQSLARILSVPAGAECTGLQVKDNVNGFAYVMSNFQHPGDWTFKTPSQDGLKAAVTANWGALKSAKAAVGYISGIPSLG